MGDLIVDQEFVEMRLDALTPHPASARIGDVTAIVESMGVNGNYNVIVAQRSTGLILAGRHRWQALQKRGDETALVALVDVDDVTALRIVYVDNATHDVGTYATDTLADVLSDMDDYAGTGYDDATVATILADAGRIPADDEPGKVTLTVRFDDCDRYDEFMGALPELLDEWAVDTPEALVLAMLRHHAQVD